MKKRSPLDRHASKILEIFEKLPLRTMCATRQYLSLAGGTLGTKFDGRQIESSGTGGPAVANGLRQTPNKSGIPNSDVPIRQIRSRTFGPFRHIYTQGSITNVTKPHKFGPLTRPGTLLGQAANCFILGEKIHRNLIVCPHLFTHPLISNSSKQIAFVFFSQSCDASTITAIFAHYKEGKAITFSHV